MPASAVEVSPMNPLSDWFVDLRAIVDHQQRLRDEAGYRTLLAAETDAAAPRRAARGWRRRLPWPKARIEAASCGSDGTPTVQLDRSGVKDFGSVETCLDQNRLRTTGARPECDRVARAGAARG
jgi:hypothetical protein